MNGNRQGKGELVKVDGEVHTLSQHGRPFFFFKLFRKMGGGDH